MFVYSYQQAKINNKTPNTKSINRIMLKGYMYSTFFLLHVKFRVTMGIENGTAKTVINIIQWVYVHQE